MGTIENRLVHECFPQPSDDTISVWRYLDFAKFVWLLDKQQLYLPRLDTLNDSHEGSTPLLLASAREGIFRKMGIPPDKIQQTYRNLRTCFYVGCWYMGNAESEAMWRLYCGSDGGVAVRTSYRKLKSVLNSDEELYLGQVTYIDYETQWFRDGNFFYPVMHKRVSFAHENEVRLVKLEWKHINGDPTQMPLGSSVPISPEDLIEAVHVSPYAPPYYHEAVCSVTKRLNPALGDRVIWSKMKAVPRY